MCTLMSLTHAWRRVCTSPEYSLHTACFFLVLCPENIACFGPLSFPALSIFLRMNSRLCLGSSFPCHSLETFQATTVFNLLVSHLLGITLLCFLISNVFKLVFSHILMSVFFFILWKQNLNSCVIIQSRMYLNFQNYCSTDEYFKLLQILATTNRKLQWNFPDREMGEFPTIPPQALNSPAILPLLYLCTLLIYLFSQPRMNASPNPFISRQCLHLRTPLTLVYIFLIQTYETALQSSAATSRQNV